MPGVRLLIVVERTRSGDPDEPPEISYYLSSIPPRKGCASTFAALIRNHWARDHCMREDSTRMRSYNANCALTAFRVCLLVVKSLLYPDSSWPLLTERCQRHPDVALSAILKLRSK